MTYRYVHLALQEGWDVALPVQAVSRILHRADPDYGLWAPQARSLAAALGVRPVQGQPGVLVVLAEGSCWHAGDVRLGTGEGASYLPVPSWALEGDPPWCRGVLLGEADFSFVADPASLEGLRA